MICHNQILIDKLLYRIINFINGIFYRNDISLKN